jgi:hypothetical protein
MKSPTANQENDNSSETIFSQMLPDDIKEKIKTGAFETQIELPLWPEDKKAMPNELARASLFVPTARGRRKMLDKEQLAAPAGIVIEFTGKQLDMSDCDVFLLSLDYARKQPLGNPILINKADFLRKLNRRERGGKGYKNLEEQFDRLHVAKIKVSSSPKKIHIHLIDRIIEDDEKGTYEIIIHPDIVHLFDNNRFCYINWDKRLQIGTARKDLAKWLQTYISSHSKSKPHKVSLEKLKAWSDYEVKNIRVFRMYVREALAELERLQIITDAAIDKQDMVSWTRL